MRRVPSEGVGETNARFDFAELPGRMEWIAVRGIAVTIAERVAALAQPGEVIVSSTVKDIVAGSGIEFEERGEHDLDGVPGTWRLFAAMT
jgi:class 3 adenylate cyclase